MATKDMWADDGFVKVDNVMNSGHVVCDPYEGGITSTGSTAAGAYQLTSTRNVISTAASGAGVRLPSIDATGARVHILNNGTNNVVVYPPTGGTINGGSIDAGVTITNKGTTSVPVVASFTQTGTLTYLQG